jgi:hypothetical protein
MFSFGKNNETKNNINHENNKNNNNFQERIQTNF